MLTQERLKEFISYNQETGEMFWLKSNSICIKIGDPIKGKTVRGYKRAQIDKVRYKAHDLVWLYVTGSFPKFIIDHKDCNPENLKWENLREATQMQNCANRSLNKNSTSGSKGVTWHKRERKWYARVGVNGKRITIGTFLLIEDAISAVRNFRMTAHGEFANHG